MSDPLAPLQVPRGQPLARLTVYAHSLDGGTLESARILEFADGSFDVEGVAADSYRERVTFPAGYPRVAPSAPGYLVALAAEINRSRYSSALFELAPFEP